MRKTNLGSRANNSGTKGKEMNTAPANALFLECCCHLSPIQCHFKSKTTISLVFILFHKKLKAYEKIDVML
jgi:hypothetical protein